jgi:uncharacterized protein YbcI
MTRDTDVAEGRVRMDISNAAVAVLRENSGRGPTSARTAIHDGMVTILFEETLSQTERTLVGNGKSDIVMTVRYELQRAMRDQLVEVVEHHTGRRVKAFMSANHIEPDYAVEVLILQE